MKGTRQVRVVETRPMALVTNSIGTLVVLCLGLLVLAACSSSLAMEEPGSTGGESRTDHLPQAADLDWSTVSDAQWQEWMTPLQYRVCRQAGTERPGTGALLRGYDPGRDFHCSACGQVLFAAATKYESGTGWPSFWDVHPEGSVAVHVDRSYGMVREEVVCGTCSAHLGHVFPDGPRPTGRRYCINSVCLFQPPPDADGNVTETESTNRSPEPKNEPSTGG